MFINLLIKELKQNAKSITFIISVLIIAFFFFTQYVPLDSIDKPLENQESYGNKYTDDKNIIMSETLKKLLREYSYNSYVTYPIGFYKETTLNDKKSEQIRTIIEQITDMKVPKPESAEEKETYTYDGQNIEHVSNCFNNIDIDKYSINPNVDYNDFVKLMEKVDDILGGGSSYQKNAIEHSATVPMTYEDSIANYNNLVYKDKISNACARIFCDYLGIVLGIIPVFMAISRCLKDNRNLACSVIHSKKASSFSIIVSRYLSIVLLFLILIMIIAIQPTYQCLYLGNSLNIEIDIMSFYKYIFVWLLPTILFTVSVGFFFTELTNTIIAMFVQMVIFFVSLFSSAYNLVGSVGCMLMIRFNTIDAYDVYEDVLNEIIINRIVYTLLAVVLISLTVIIYSAKRRGIFSANGKLFRLSKNKSEN